MHLQISPTAPPEVAQKVLTYWTTFFENGGYENHGFQHLEVLPPAQWEWVRWAGEVVRVIGTWRDLSSLSYEESIVLKENGEVVFTDAALT